MKLRTLLVLGLICAVSVYADAPKGTVPRASADDYPAHTVHDGVAIGAVMLTPEQVRKAFPAELSRCCRVVEVALYPTKDKPINVALGDFGLRIAGSETALKPLTAEVLASKVQKKPSPSAPSSGGPDVMVEQTSGIGYKTGGIDPRTGQRTPGGVYTTSGVGVGVGVGGKRTPTPDSGDRGRASDSELAQKGLPEGNAASPVSGYLYFEVSSSKDKKANQQLEYWLNAEKIVLQLQ